MRIWSVVAEMVGSHGRCALVTVAQVRGSAPREPGARMAIAPDGGFRGTIGGGELEWRAIAEARDALSLDTPSATLRRMTLGPDLGQCCGGSVRVLTEVFDRDRLDELRALAAREAAGPFVSEGWIGPLAVERIVDGPPGTPRRDDARRPVVPRSGTTGPPFGLRAEVDGVSGGCDAGGELPIEEGGESPRGGVADNGFSKGEGGDRCDRGVGRAGVTIGAGPPFELRDDGVIVERFSDPRRPVWLFGAGHVGRALMLALAPLPFDVTWIDEREDAFPAAMPSTVRRLRSADPAGELVRAPTGAFVVVMTHSHPRDLAIVHAALAAARFGYVGLIGSASKRARFIRRLRDAGVGEARIAELVCPIGVSGIGSKLPAAIAASVAVQLLERDEAIAASAVAMHGAELRAVR